MLQPDTVTDAAVSAIRDMICDGRLAAASRINEVHLARDLGVSRTPLREALNRLASEGALDVRARLGFFVRPLTLDEFEQIYDLRPLLDPEALRLAGVPKPAVMKRLEELNRKLANTRDAEAAIALDDEWHFTLIEACPNKALVDLIHGVVLRTRRYELALMQEDKNGAAASEDHMRIMKALRVNDLEAACAWLKHNMQSGKAPIVAWLKARASAGNKK